LPIVQANGINIYYELHGKGDPLLLIDGLASDLTQTEGMVRTLSEKRQVIAFDNRGAGRTDKPDVPYSIEMMAEDTVRLLDALHISRADVLGISMGGRVAVSLALNHPEVAKSLILASTSPKMTYHRGILWSFSNLLVRIPMVRAVGSKYPQPYYAYVRQREASHGYDVAERLKEIRVPTLILHGKKDRIVPYKLAEEMHAGIAGSELIVFDGGHLFPFSKLKEFTSSVEGFLGRQIPRTPD